MKAALSRAGVPAFLVLCALCAIALGAAGASLVLHDPVPQGLQPGKRITSVQVETIDYFDEHTVSLALREGEPKVLTLQQGGRLTSLNCISGKPVSSGSVIATIDSKPYLALATAMPLYRDLHPGDQGPDVDALLAELNRLGSGVANDGVLGQDTLDVISRLIFEAGYPLESMEYVPFARIVWIPSASTGIQRCDVQLGQTVTDGTEFAHVPGQLQGAAIDTSSLSAVAGSRQVDIGGKIISVDDSGIITGAEDLQALASLPGFAKAIQQEDPVPLEGIWRLAEPITAASVPAMILSDVGNGSACVWDEEKPIPVEVLGSQLGQTLVRAKAGTLPGKLSTSAPSSGAVCAPQ